MLGKKSVLDSLATRRLALVAESDMNRAQIAHEWEALKQEGVRLINPMRRAGRYISTGAKAVGALLALKKVWSQSHDADGKRNWMATLLQTARIGISLWPAFRSRAR
ncbi:MAG TPA: hypothetical protein VN516_01000 [Candidatus Baltobacteraceae bacterium]|nr:hypothetical protein [Candidatus Baltobacteraceae bacterium]